MRHTVPTKHALAQSDCKSISMNSIEYTELSHSLMETTMGTLPIASQREKKTHTKNRKYTRIFRNEPTEFV